MAISCLTNIKSYLHYNFMVKVHDALSTLVIMSGNKTNQFDSSEESSLIIFGKGKSWILIESMN